MTHNITVDNNRYYDINPVQFGYEDCENAHHFGPAVRTHWLIHFVVSGCGIYKRKNNTYQVKSGEMFVIPPDEETYYQADTVNPWSYIWIGFTTNCDITEYLCDVISCPDAEKIFEKMKKCEEYTDGRSLYLAARILDLFVLLSKRGSTKTKDYIQEALDCIHSEYMYDLSVSELAQRVHLERTYFTVLFKKRTGISPKQYLLNYRMSIAASLITQGNIAISVVAYSVGYSDLYLFSKMFKRHFGVSPTVYAGRNLS